MATTDRSRLVLRPIPPFRLDLTVWALRRGVRNAIDRWDGTTYRRVLVIRGRPFEINASQAGSCATPTVIVTTTPALRATVDRDRVRSAIEGLLGLRVDLRDWYLVVERDRRLKKLVEQFRGVKPPRFPTVFEALVNAFACQQLSLTVGLELLNRLAGVCNVRYESNGDAHFAFPAPADVAAVPTAAYRAIGFSRQKTVALLALARAVTHGHLDLERLTRENDDLVREQLVQLPGVGRWTTEYVLLRGLGRLNVFPGDDVGAQNALARWRGESVRPDYAEVNRLIERWQPYAGLVYFHLLLDSLAQAEGTKRHVR